MKSKVAFDAAGRFVEHKQASGTAAVEVLKETAKKFRVKFTERAFIYQPGDIALVPQWALDPKPIKPKKPEQLSLL